ncbi:MAG: O-antigen ligase family protein [Chloroflexi bacterium]|nr:O-antigen ligase family protein [Chloroflexota bacterium]
MSARAALATPATRLQPRPVLLALLAIAVGGTSALLSPFQAAALLAAAVVVPFALQRPIVGLCLAVAAIPFSSEWSSTVGGLNLTLMEPTVALALVAWLRRGLAQERLRIWPSALLAAQGLMLGVLLAASLASEAPGPSLKETIKWIELMVAFVLTLDLARDIRAARWLLLALVGAAAVEALFGVVQFVTGRGPAFFAIGPFMRAYGHFSQPNPFAGYLGTALPLALALAWLMPGAAPRWARPAFLALAAGVLLSLSRGAWLGQAVACAALLALASPRSRRHLLVLAVALLLLALLGTLGVLPPAIADRLGIIAEYFGPFDVRTVEVTGENWSVVERMAHWQAAWYMFLDRPWLGVGPGNYATAYEQYFLPNWADPLGHAHNYYLNLAAETGLVGLATFLLVLGLAYRAAVRGLGSSDPFWRTVALGTLGTLLALTVHSSFDSLFVHGVGVQIGTLFGLAQLASDRRDTEGR